MQPNISICSNGYVYFVWLMSAGVIIPNLLPLDWQFKLMRLDRLYMQPLPCCPFYISAAWVTMSIFIVALVGIGTHMPDGLYR
jgi:hypothetical protein